MFQIEHSGFCVVANLIFEIVLTSSVCVVVSLVNSFQNMGNIGENIGNIVENIDNIVENICNIAERKFFTKSVKKTEHYTTVNILVRT